MKKNVVTTKPFLPSPEPRNLGTKVEHRFLFVAIPQCGYDVQVAWVKFR